jgi:putative ABC transport system permease protein
MRVLREWRQRLWGTFHPGRPDNDLEQELRFHLESAAEDARRTGRDTDNPLRIARIEAGGTSQAMEAMRDQRGLPWADNLARDMRHGFRTLRRSPVFTAVALVTLALGFGANSAMFALADATLSRPLPYPQPDRLLMIWSRHPAVPRAGVSPMDLRDLEEQSQTFEALAAVMFGAGGGPLVEGPDGSVQSADRQTVTPRFFDVLGVIPVAGRTFQPADAVAGAPATVVMTEGLWRTRFGADPSVVGRQVRLNGDPFTVIGIVRDDAQLQRPAQIWTLLPRLTVERNARMLQAIGRVKPGVTIDAARADLAVIASRLARSYAETNKDWTLSVEPLRTGVMGSALENTSVLLLGVVGFVLLLCCANVANLLLARGTARAREFAVRAALGAGRSRIVAQTLAESLVLATLGGIAGGAIGAVILKTAPSVIPAGLLPAAAALAFDRRVAMFCASAALIVGVLVGLVPAWQATRMSLLQAISLESRSSTRRGAGFRHVLVAGEIALAVVLLCGAGLLLRTLLVVNAFDPGYRADSDSVLTLDFSLPGPRPGTRYPNVQSLTQFYDGATRDVQAIPGVRKIGWSTGLPYGTTSEIGGLFMDIVGDPPLPSDQRPHADFQAASPGYFDTIDLPIIAGRAFTERDAWDSPRVCLVSEAFARRYGGGRNLVGLRVRTAGQPGLFPAVEREIVGVVRQLKDRVDEPEEPAQVYVPLAQFPWTDTYLVVQASAGRVEALIAPIREAIARIDRNVPVRRERTLTQLGDLNTAPHRFRAAIVATFAGLALVLAMVGIFGVLAYLVEQRTRELGIRIALGATAASLLRLVVGNAARVVAVGVAMGFIVAAVLARTISTFLFGVEPIDPVTFGVVGLLLVMTVAMATAGPAWRATRVDPVEAFRAE